MLIVTEIEPYREQNKLNTVHMTGTQRNPETLEQTKKIEQTHVLFSCSSLLGLFLSL